ncbi:MAG: phosphoserine phosphatase SerB [Mariprofundaceae bacterium]|nr:phosphoserine phosphatase SerB [Mariprofundaceae bacterium]
MNQSDLIHVLVYGCQQEQAISLLKSHLICHIETSTENNQVLKFTVDSPFSCDELKTLWSKRPESEHIDILFYRHDAMPTLKQAGCLFMDMDSTLVTCECIDEIADFMGIKDTIANITLRAMQGELDFSQSLRERVNLLAGLDAKVLETVYQQRIHLTSGAEKLITTLQQHGWQIALVSGGFTYFTDQLHQRLKLDFSQANVLEIQDGKLTGHVVGDIVDAQSKRRFLLEKAQEWGIAPSQTVAIGDGANDLPMLDAAAVGVAFHAKPKVCEQADYSISQAGLDALLDLLED